MKLNVIGGLNQADPYIIKHNNCYYVYATGYEGVQLYISKDFHNYEYHGIVFSLENQKEYWAPSVIFIDGYFYMYVSYMPKESDDVHMQHIVVARSKNPSGPFEYLNDLTDAFSIDPHVVESGDELFMFYSINDYDAQRAGTLIVVDKMKSPTEMCNNPKIVVRATLDEEIFMENRFKEGQHWHTLEGAFYFRKGDYHYVMYSGNCYENEKYYLGYAVCESKENDLTKLNFKKYPDENTYLPLINKNEFEEGTGHNSILEENGTFYVIYHGRDYGEDKNRTMRYAEIKAEAEKLEVIKR